VDSQVDPQPQFAFTIEGVGFIGALQEQPVCCESEQEERQHDEEQAVGQSVGQDLLLSCILIRILFLYNSLYFFKKSFL
jgi:hypothetical protein